MAGLGIRVYTDENVDPKLAEQLRHHGYDAISCHGAGNHNQGRSDEWQLAYSTQHDRAILTHNVADFIGLDKEWKLTGQAHAGIVCIPGYPAIGELVKRAIKHLDQCIPEHQYNAIHWI